MNHRRFRGLVHAVLLSSGPFAALLACSTESNPGTTSTTGTDGGDVIASGDGGGTPEGGLPATVMPEKATCVDLKAASRYKLLTVTAPIDGIAFASHGPIEGPLPEETDAGTIPFTALESVGTPCATATDQGACLQKVNALLGSADAETWEVTTQGDCGGGGCARTGFRDVGVATQGNDVRLVTRAEVFAASAPIENLAEASTLAALSGWTVRCDANTARTEADGSFTFQNIASRCSGRITEQFLKVTRDGKVESGGERVLREADNGCIEGRRPANLVASGSPWLSSVTACFAEIAHMETASVRAFDDLEADLCALGAPVDLLERARRARADEVAHAAITTAIAHRFGATPRAPRVGLHEANALKSARTLAIENAVEGCVREAFGALVAAWQATHAEDAGVREAFAQIALDEAEHAELSFAIDAWLDASLSASERREVEAAKARAWEDLAIASRVEPAAEVVRVAGMPTASQALALLESLHGAVEDVAA